MQSKTIELKQAPVVLVELPEGAKEAHLDIRTGRICWSAPMEGTKGGSTWHYLPSDYRGANAIGILSDLTEEQFAECVERIDQEYTFGYRDYTGFIDDLSKARHSFSSLLESEKVYTENPLEKVEKSVGHGTLDNFDQDYEEAQQRTIDPRRTVVLLRRGGIEMKKLKTMMVAALALLFFAMFGITLHAHLSVGEKKETYPRIKQPVLDSRIVFLIGSGTDEDPFIAIPIPDSLHYKLSEKISPDVYYNAIGEIVDSAKSARFRGNVYRADRLMESVDIIHKYLFEDL